MRILIVTSIYPPDIGGPASFTPELRRGLIGKGHHVDLIHLTNSQEYQATLDNGMRTIGIQRSGCKLMRFIRVVAWVIRLSRRYRYEIVMANNLHLECATSSLFIETQLVHKIVGDRAWEVARRRSIYEDTIDEFQKTQKSFLVNVLKAVRTTSLLRAKLVIVPSEYMEKIVKGWLGRNRKEIVHVIYNSVPVANIVQRESSRKLKELKLLTVCRLVRWKGVDMVIEALKELPQCSLEIIGDGPEMEDLQVRVKNLELTERVIFKGSVDKKAVSLAMSEADAFILNTSYEGLSHVILEAFQHKIPVITTLAGGNVELVRDLQTGIVIRNNSLEDIRASVELVRGNKELVIWLKETEFTRARVGI